MKDLALRVQDSRWGARGRRKCFHWRGREITEREKKKENHNLHLPMAFPAAAEVAGKAASLLKFGAGVYLFRDWLCEPTVVRDWRERKKGKKKRRLISIMNVPIGSVLRSTSTKKNKKLKTIQCVGPSMLPTLQARGDVVLAESLSVRTGKLRVGDVVVARSPTNASHTVCKRVLGLGGDLVDVGEPSSSGGSGTLPSHHPSGIVVPEGYAWLQGDNHGNSTDSRSYGPVPVALVRARVYFRAWPPSRIGRVTGGESWSKGDRRWYEQEYNDGGAEKGRRGR